MRSVATAATESRASFITRFGGLVDWLEIDRAIASQVRRLQGRGAHNRSVAEALAVCADVTRTGGSFLQACQVISREQRGPVAAAFDQVVARSEVGIGVERACDELAESIGGSDIRLFADVLVVQHRRGGDLGVICDRVSTLVDERISLRRDARSATAQARFTAKAVILIPVILAVFAVWLQPDAAARMVQPAIFWLALPALVMILAGVLVVRRIAASAQAVEQSMPRPASRRASAVMDYICGGHSSVSLRALRSTVAGIICAGAWMLAMIAISSSLPVLLQFVVAAVVVIAAGSWPVAELRTTTRRLRIAADQGVPTVLEVSLALLSAGATTSEAAHGAITAAPHALREQLQPATVHAQLGDSLFLGLFEQDVVRESLELRAWVVALQAGDRHGLPIVDRLNLQLASVREKHRERLKSRAATAGPRMQIAIVCLFVPAILWIILLGAGASLIDQLANVGVM